MLSRVGFLKFLFIAAFIHCGDCRRRNLITALNDRPIIGETDY